MEVRERADLYTPDINGIADPEGPASVFSLVAYLKGKSGLFRAYRKLREHCGFAVMVRMCVCNEIGIGLRVFCGSAGRVYGECDELTFNGPELNRKMRLERATRVLLPEDHNTKIDQFLQLQNPSQKERP